MNDIFKDMQAKVGCDYISDLPSYKRKVWQEMKRLNPADYEEKQLEDFSKYVFGMSYQTLKDVMKQQKGREEQCRKQGCWWKRKEQLEMCIRDRIYLSKKSVVQLKYTVDIHCTVQNDISINKTVR